MPNWCSNWIVITGEEKPIKKITTLLENIKDKSESNVFKTLIGFDKSLTPEQYDNGGWYDSNVRRFGTKWDVSYEDCCFDFSNDRITISIDTAWSPPTEFCKQLSMTYKVNVHITYEEGGCDFAGFAEYTPKGETEETYGYKEGLYKTNTDSFWANLDYDIQCALEENTGIRAFMKEFDFVSKEDKKRIKELFNEAKNN